MNKTTNAVRAHQQKSKIPWQLLSFSLLQPSGNIVLQNGSHCVGGKSIKTSGVSTPLFLKWVAARALQYFSCFSNTRQFFLTPHVAAIATIRAARATGAYSSHRHWWLIQVRYFSLCYSPMPFKYIWNNNTRFAHEKRKLQKWFSNQHICCDWNIRKYVWIYSKEKNGFVSFKHVLICHENLYPGTYKLRMNKHCVTTLTHLSNTHNIKSMQTACNADWRHCTKESCM